MDIETENKMKEYLMNQKTLKKHKHIYTLEEFNLTPKVIKDSFRDYIKTKLFQV